MKANVTRTIPAYSHYWDVVRMRVKSFFKPKPKPTMHSPSIYRNAALQNDNYTEAAHNTVLVAPIPRRAGSGALPHFLDTDSQFFHEDQDRDDVDEGSMNLAASISPGSSTGSAGSVTGRLGSAISRICSPRSRVAHAAKPVRHVASPVGKKVVTAIPGTLFGCIMVRDGGLVAGCDEVVQVEHGLVCEAAGAQARAESPEAVQDSSPPFSDLERSDSSDSVVSTFSETCDDHAPSYSGAFSNTGHSSITYVPGPHIISTTSTSTSPLSLSDSSYTYTWNTSRTELQTDEKTGACLEIHDVDHFKRVDYTITRTIVRPVAKDPGYIRRACSMNSLSGAAVAAAAATGGSNGIMGAGYYTPPRSPSPTAALTRATSPIEDVLACFGAYGDHSIEDTFEEEVERLVERRNLEYAGLGRMEIFVTEDTVVTWDIRVIDKRSQAHPNGCLGFQDEPEPEETPLDEEFREEALMHLHNPGLRLLAERRG